MPMNIVSIITVGIIIPQIALAYINPGVMGYWLQLFFAGALALTIKFWLWWRKKGNVGLIRKKTKADSLWFLKENMDEKLFLEQVSIKREEFESHPTGCIRRIQKRFKRGALVVRSSFIGEDQFLESHAGAYKSLLGVPSESSMELRKSLAEVFASNPKPRDSDQVLIQVYIDAPKIVGVLFSRIPGAPGQFSLSYNDQSPKPEGVTSGLDRSKNFVFFRHKAIDHDLPSWSKDLIQASLKIEKLLMVHAVDIEFVVLADGTLKILQARPLVHSIEDESTPPLNTEITIARPLENSVLSRMSDWNPVEILGARAKPLDRSLYRKFICQKVWTEERSQLGYQRASRDELLQEVLGQDYVDTSLVFASLMPEGIDENIRDRIIGEQTKYLREHPDLHDQIEFSICLSHPSLYRGQLSRSLEILNISAEDKSKISQDLEKISLRVVSQIQKLVESGNLFAHRAGDLSEAYQVCQGQARLFVQTARASFIAKAWLMEFESKSGEVLSHIVARGTREALLTHREFLKENGVETESVRQKAFSITSAKVNFDYGKVDHLADTSRRPILGLSPDEAILSADRLEQFIYQSNFARELNKRQFYWALSQYLDLLLQATPSQFKDYIDFFEVDELEALVRSEKNFEISELAQRKRSYENKIKIRFPDVFFGSEEFLCFEERTRLGHFIGTGSLQGDVIYLAADSSERDLRGKIVVFERGEPGLDWVFDQRPKAVLTRYGGPNSHVAIRCHEAGCKGLLGLDENSFSAVKTAKNILLNCDTKTFELG